MIQPILPPQTPIEDTAHENEAAKGQSIAIEAWKRVARAECQLKLLRNLKNSNLGVAEVENFLKNLEGAKKCKRKS